MLNKKSKKDISLVLSSLASLLPDKGKEHILNKTFGKHMNEVLLIISYLKENEKILDVGGGVGINLMCLRKLKPDVELFLIDKLKEHNENHPIASKEIAIKILKDAGISICIYDFWENNKLPYDSNYFDLITAFDVIEHFPEPPFKLLKEINRILKKDGTLIISVPNLISTARRGRLLIGKHPYIDFDEWISDNYYGHYRECTRKEWKKIIEISDFKIIKWFMSNEPTKTKAFNSFHFKRYNRLSLPAFGLWCLYLIDRFFPWLRTAIYFVAKKNNHE